MHKIAAAEPKKQQHSINADAIRKKSEEGNAYFRSGCRTSSLRGPSLDDLLIIPAQLSGNLPRDPNVEQLEASLVIGEELERPLVLRIPMFVFSGMYGAISDKARLALAYGAALCGTAAATGDSLILEEERGMRQGKGAKIIAEYSTQRCGLDTNTLSAVDAIEIKISGGAAAGSGATLNARRMSATVAKTRRRTIEQNVHNPARHLDMEIPEDLKLHVQLLRELTNYRIPIIVKVGAGNVYADVKAAIASDADAVNIDVSEHFVEGLPNSVIEHSGLSPIAALAPAKRAFKEAGAKELGVKLLFTGDFADGGDIFKAIAFGADAVGLGLAARMAIGCENCGLCEFEECSHGIATTEAASESKLDWESAGQRLANFLRGTSRELNILTALAGHNDIREIGTDDLRAKTYDAAAISGVKLAGYDKVLPMWSH